MASWWLSFRTSTAISMERIAELLTTLIAQPEAHFEDWAGDPREGYGRRVSLLARTSEVTLTLRLSQSCQYEGGPILPGTESLRFELDGGHAFLHRMTIWSNLRAALEALGYQDFTLAESPAPIVSDLEAAGEAGLAAALRKQTTEALVNVVPRYRHVSLGYTEPDDMDAVLRAYVSPESIVSASFTQCGLRGLPAALARFPNLRTLQLDEPNLLATCLRGWSFASLESLALGRLDIHALTALDCVGFPALTTLVVTDAPLTQLEKDLLSVCKSLRRVVLVRTPLANAVARLAQLRSAWPHVSLECSV